MRYRLERMRTVATEMFAPADLVRPRRLANALALSFPLAGPQLLKRLHLPIRIGHSSELAIDLGELEVG